MISFCYYLIQRFTMHALFAKTLPGWEFCLFTLFNAKFEFQISTHRFKWSKHTHQLFLFHQHSMSASFQGIQLLNLEKIVMHMAQKLASMLPTLLNAKASEPHLTKLFPCFCSLPPLSPPRALSHSPCSHPLCFCLSLYYSLWLLSLSRCSDLFKHPGPLNLHFLSSFTVFSLFEVQSPTFHQAESCFRCQTCWLPVEVQERWYWT